MDHSQGQNRDQGLDCAARSHTHTALHETDRPPDHPGDLLKRYVYRYPNRIRSSRQLAQDAPRNLELLGLRKRPRPDLRTSAELRPNNRQAIRRG